MSNNLKYDLGLNNKQFRTGMKEAFNDTAKLDKKMSGFMNMDTGLMQGVTAGNLLAQGITAAGGAAVGFVKDSIRAFGDFEQFQTSLTTMFQGNTQKAQMLSDQLQQFAKSTPFELTEIQNATKMMLAYGSTAGSVVGEMRMLGDISSGVGAPLQDIAYLYGTLRTQGRAYMTDIRQFAGRGIPIYEALAKTMKVSRGEINQLVEKGKVGFKEVERALSSLTEQGGQFAGMMDKQSQTLNGQISNLADGWEQLKVKIGESQSGILKGTVNFATDFLNEINAVYDMTNRLDKALAKGSAKGFSWWDKNGMNTDEYDRYLQYSENIKRSYVDKAGTSEASALRGLAGLSAAKKGLLENYQSGKISATDFNRQMAIINEGRAQIQTTLSTLKETANKKKEEDSPKSGGNMSSQKLGSTHEISGAKPQSITINITKLADIQLHTTNLQESGQVVRREISKHLLEVANDVNTMSNA